MSTKVEIPDLTPYTVQQAEGVLSALKLKLALCKKTDSPQADWIYNLAPYSERDIEAHHEDTEAGDEIDEKGTVGVTLVGGLEIPPTKAPAASQSATSITINIFVGGGQVDIKGG